jgi:hypothetical protein
MRLNEFLELSGRDGKTVSNQRARLWNTSFLNTMPQLRSFSSGRTFGSKRELSSKIAQNNSRPRTIMKESNYPKDRMKVPTKINWSKKAEDNLRRKERLRGWKNR